MSACSPNFESKFALINGKTIPFDEYARMENKPPVYCIPNKHELVPVFCTKRKPHFRHKHATDLDGHPMTQWHAEWQSNFPVTEIPFKNNSKQLRGRRADVVIPQLKRVIEIQHSKIESGEVNDRMADYKVHGHSVEWIIDAQGCILVKNIGDRIVLHFTVSWLHESFRGCDAVYYDINEVIYKATPSHVKSCQIEVCKPMLKADFIKNINTCEDLWRTGELPQSHIYLMQKGAGSGKTYGMIQLLNDHSEITMFKYVIFITKQHSAVNVMFTEFMTQYVEGKLTNIELFEEPRADDGSYDHSMFQYDKKFIVPYRHKLTNIQTFAIFATVDSFTHAVGEAVSDAHDTFVSIVKSIKDGFSKVTREGKLKFAKMPILVNKETLIMIDEAQDLTKLYGEAFLQFVHSTNTNMCVCGDRLQSLQNAENALTFLHDAKMPMTRIIKESASNEIRRFSDPQLIRFVNSMIKFEEWDLPKMTPHKVVEESGALTIFSAETVYANQDSKCDEVVRSVTQIMTFFEREVTVNKCLPEDFLFVTPFTKQNPLMEALQLAVNEFWKHTMQNNPSYIEDVKSKNDFWNRVNPNSYTRYAIFHKAQEVGSINLEESAHATRMVSIHTSKGDGRKVVFVIGVTEASLRRFSEVVDNIIYNSLLHVPITRQKERLYFRLEENGDDVHTRIKNSSEEVSRVSTKFDYPRKAIQLTNLADELYTSHWDTMYENILCKVDIPLIPLIPKPREKVDVLLLDMSDHNIRYSSTLINVMVHRCNYEHNLTLEGKARSDRKLQFNAIFGNIHSHAIKEVTTSKEYYQTLSENTKIKENYRNNIQDDIKQTPVIPMLYFEKNKTDIDYDRYSRIIRMTMDRVRHELTSYKGKLDYFCPFESVICYYMLECIQSGKYQKISINDVYNIVDVYSKTFDSSAEGHDTCKCKTHFTGKIADLTANEKKYHKYLMHHYDRMNQLIRLLDGFSKKYPSVDWLYDTHIEYDGGNTDFKLNKRYTLVGYDKENVYVFDIKPQLTDLNHNEMKINGLLDTWLISNVSADKPKYANKNIISCVLSLNITEVYTINWTEAVRANSNYLNQQIYTAIEQTNQSKNKSYYTTFMNVIEERKDVKNILSYLQSSYLDDDARKRPIPQYIIEFWTFMKNRVEFEDGKAAKMALLSEYKNETYFLTKINRILHRSLNAFFGIEEDDD
jgi:hypothetical protein